MTLPIRIEDWPDEIEAPEELTNFSLAAGGECPEGCVSMYMMRVLGGDSERVGDALMFPQSLLEQIGVPVDIAAAARKANDHDDRAPSDVSHWDALMESCGYEIVEYEE